MKVFPSTYIFQRDDAKDVDAEMEASVKKVFNDAKAQDHSIASLLRAELRIVTYKWYRQSFYSQLCNRLGCDLD